MDYKQYCIDYVEGRVPYKDFCKLVREDDVFSDWLNSHAGAMHSITMATEANHFKSEELPFSMRFQLTVWEKNGSYGDQLNIQWYVHRILTDSFPELVLAIDPTVREMFDLQLDAMPEYIDGVEIWECGIIDRIVDECPKELSRTKKIKYIKEQIKKEFHLEGSKYPRWIQNPMWPVANGKPMKFVKTIKKHKGEWKDHYFIDVETGEERIVEDFY